jgi:hypothetical protein
VTNEFGTGVQSVIASGAINADGTTKGKLTGQTSIDHIAASGVYNINIPAGGVLTDQGCHVTNNGTGGVPSIAALASSPTQWRVATFIDGTPTDVPFSFTVFKAIGD